MHAANIHGYSVLGLRGVFMRKIQMGVIGLGGISKSHINGILSSPDAELVALCDIDSNALQEKSKMYKIPQTHCFFKYTDLLECDDVDAVSICTPNDSHFKIAREAIIRKKPFALEKPVTLNLHEAKILKEMAKKASVPNMICFSYRFKSAVRFARWIIRMGCLGNIFHVYVQYLQSWAISESLPLYWRFRQENSGSGAHGDIGSHMLDLVRFLIGDYSKICAQAGTFITERKKLNSEEHGNVDVDDYCNYIAELDGGIPVTFNITRYAYGRGNYQRVEIYGSKGGLIYHLDETGVGADTVRLCTSDSNVQPGTYRELPIPDEYNADQMQSFFDIIRGKGDGLAATIEDGYINQYLLDSIVESFEKEKWVHLNPGKTRLHAFQTL
jgi:predicted dehydrogenase